MSMAPPPVAMGPAESEALWTSLSVSWTSFLEFEVKPPLVKLLLEVSRSPWPKTERMDKLLQLISYRPYHS